MLHNWDKYFDTTSEHWEKLQALYAANEHYPKKVVKGRNLHHKFLRSWSKKEKELQDDDDDNLVSLSEGDHFLAHFYIWKSANKGYRTSAVLAVRMMYRKSFKYITDEIAEDIAKVWEHKEYAHSEDTKRKISKAHKGSHHSSETKKKMSETHKGKPLSKEHSKKISEAQRGEKSSWYGKHLPEEMKKKIAEANKGERSSWYGKHLPEEMKKKIAEANKGKHWFNNGKENKYCYECPLGFIPGRISLKNN